jgi:hypothetical protein
MKAAVLAIGLALLITGGLYLLGRGLEDGSAENRTGFRAVVQGESPGAVSMSITETWGRPVPWVDARAMVEGRRVHLEPTSSDPFITAGDSFLVYVQPDYLSSVAVYAYGVVLWSGA